jgi:class 3 adenylate cyclase/tetratricopeptide (TPR) repeat protein
VLTCPSCGEENPDRAKFCLNCGAPLGETRSTTREVRKIVTVVFSDVTGSTAMGESLDPESLRSVMSRYFDRMRTALERHGGTVEKFIGDAVMAVFGIPQVHEDDALRAVRAAAEMREALAELNKELERDHGVTIATRTGVNTGEVVAGTGGQTIATGDAVNVAARLEQAAKPGEILIGEDTLRLVRDAVDAEQVEPLDLKGKSEPVVAYRLGHVTAGAAGHARRMDSPMIGRDREATLLRQAFDRAINDRACQMFTVLGPPGVGKSRLVEEFAGSVGSSTVLRGRCLPYGEGITYFPILEMVKEAAGLADFDAPEVVETKICSVLEGDENQALVCQRVAQLMGVSEVASAEETFWAIRRMFEAVAREGPLVLLFDDIHWGEATFLDLVEHVADWSRDVPILLVCIARPELLDARPSWSGGKLNASTISLESLSDAECEALIGNLLGSEELSGVVRDRISSAAEGNPLFVEEMLSVLVDDGRLVREDGRWLPAGDLTDVTVPPTITALLAARLDRLGPEERAVLEASSVVGKEFFLGAVRELLPEGARPSVPALLMSLVRKEFIRPDRSTLPGEDMFRFRHLLIRDAAYEALPKSTRADLHERTAGWIESIAGERIAEQEEILGYHLERAHGYLLEIGTAGDRSRDLAARASEHLATAGRRAADRGDLSAASGLFLRAARLRDPDDRSRVRLLLAAARSQLDLGDYEAEDAALSEAAAGAHGDRGLEVQIEMEREILRQTVDPTAASEFIAAAERAIPLLEETGDDAALARAWWVVSWRGGATGDYEGNDEATRRSLEHARRAGDRAAERAALSSVTNVVWGPMPVPDGSARLDEVLGLAGEDRLVDCYVRSARSCLLAMSGTSVEAREAWERAHATALDLGMPDVIGFVGQEGWLVETIIGDHAAAERIARETFEILDRAGTNALRNIASDQLAGSLVELGRLDEAEAFVEVSRAPDMAVDDPFQGPWHLTLGKILAHRGDLEGAERLVREGVRVTERTQYLTDRAFSLLDLAEVLRLAGRAEEAASAVEGAIDLFEQKRNVVCSDRARRILEDLR